MDPGLLVTARGFDPLEFLGIADLLVSRHTSEASLRTAVDRLYYAAFLSAREFLGVSGRTRIHQRVIGELRVHDRIAAHQLETLRNIRVVADYDLEVRDPLRNDWQRNYQMARRLADFVLRRLQ